MSNEEILQSLGSEKPLLKYPRWQGDENSKHYNTLTSDGHKAYDKLRNILTELRNRNIITFDENKLDKEFFHISE